MSNVRVANRPRSFTLHFQAESVKTVYKSQNIHYTVMVLQNGIMVPGVPSAVIFLVNKPLEL